MKQIFANERSILPLGRCGESHARQIVFDLTEWIALYGSGTAELIYQRPGDERPHIMEVEQDNPLVRWTLTDWHTAVSDGEGECELRYYPNEGTVKSRTWRTYVEKAMETPSEEDPPDPEQGWVDQVLDAAARAEAAANRAENAGGGSSGGGDSGGGSGEGFSYKLGTGLKVTHGDTLEVDSATDFNGDNDRPASASLVKAQLGNIEAFLATI